MNGSETILAIIAACSILAAVLMAALAYRMNERWVERERKWIEIAEKQNSNAEYQNMICGMQNDLTRRMNREWYEAYVKMVAMKAEEKNGQD
jgi:hypothetical protein